MNSRNFLSEDKRQALRKKLEKLDQQGLGKHLKREAENFFFHNSPEEQERMFSVIEKVQSELNEVSLVKGEGKGKGKKDEGKPSSFSLPFTFELQKSDDGGDSKESDKEEAKSIVEKIIPKSYNTTLGELGQNVVALKELINWISQTSGQKYAVVEMDDGKIIVTTLVKSTLQEEILIPSKGQPKEDTVACGVQPSTSSQD